MKNGSKNQETINSLIKILNHEAKLKFLDSSVIGGLDSLLKKSEKLLPWLYNVEPLTGMSYSALMPGERQRWAKNVLQRIKNIQTKKHSINIDLSSKINDLKFDALVDLNQSHNQNLSFILKDLNIPIKVGFQAEFSNFLYSIIIESKSIGFLEDNYKTIEKILGLE